MADRQAGSNQQRLSAAAAAGSSPKSGFGNSAQALVQQFLAEQQQSAMKMQKLIEQTEMEKQQAIQQATMQASQAVGNVANQAAARLDREREMEKAREHDWDVRQEESKQQWAQMIARDEMGKESTKMMQDRQARHARDLSEWEMNTKKDADELMSQRERMEKREEQALLAFNQQWTDDYKAVTGILSGMSQSINTILQDTEYHVPAEQNAQLTEALGLVRALQNHAKGSFHPSIMQDLVARYNNAVEGIYAGEEVEDLAQTARYEQYKIPWPSEMDAMINPDKEDFPTLVALEKEWRSRMTPEQARERMNSVALQGGVPFNEPFESVDPDSFEGQVANPVTADLFLMAIKNDTISKFATTKKTQIRLQTAIAEETERSIPKIQQTIERNRVIRETSSKAVMAQAVPMYQAANQDFLLKLSSRPGQEEIPSGPQFRTMTVGRWDKYEEESSAYQKVPLQEGLDYAADAIVKQAFIQQAGGTPQAEQAWELLQSALRGEAVYDTETHMNLVMAQMAVADGLDALVDQGIENYAPELSDSFVKHVDIPIGLISRTGKDDKGNPLEVQGPVEEVAQRWAIQQLAAAVKVRTANINLALGNQPIVDQFGSFVQTVKGKAELDAAVLEDLTDPDPEQWGLTYDNFLLSLRGEKASERTERLKGAEKAVRKPIRHYVSRVKKMTEKWNQFPSYRALVEAILSPHSNQGPNSSELDQLRRAAQEQGGMSADPGGPTQPPQPGQPGQPQQQPVTQRPGEPGWGPARARAAGGGVQPAPAQTAQTGPTPIPGGMGS